MCGPECLLLVINMAFCSFCFCNLQKTIFCFFSKLTNDETNISDFFFANLNNVFNKPLHNRLPCQRNQRLWYRQCMRAHALACSGHRYDNLHKPPSPPKGGTALLLSILFICF